MQTKHETRDEGIDKMEVGMFEAVLITDTSGCSNSRYNQEIHKFYFIF